MNVRRSAFPIVLMLFASCATAQSVREINPGERPALATDEAGLWRIVERDEYMVRTSGAVVRDPELQAYLESVLCATVPEHCRDIRIYVIPSYRLGTRMSANGMMLVTTGLLLRLSNEAQLAAVLGHEAAHYIKRHSLGQLRATRSHVNRVGVIDTIIETGVDLSDVDTAVTAGRGGIGFRGFGWHNLGLHFAGGLLAGILRAASDKAAYNYSMEQESEADATSLSWVADAGYAPQESVAVWSLMQSEQAAHPQNRFSYLYAHRHQSVRSPEELSIYETSDNMKKRTETVARHANNLRGDHLDANRIGQAEYMRKIEPFRHEWLLHARGGLPSALEESLITRQREIGASPGLVLFHEAQMIRERDGEGDGALALETFREALAAEGHPPETHRELGFVLWHLGEPEAARRAFERYLTNHPGAPDQAMIRHHIDELGN